MCYRQMLLLSATTLVQATIICHLGDTGFSRTPQMISLLPFFLSSNLKKIHFFKGINLFVYPLFKIFAGFCTSHKIQMYGSQGLAWSQSWLHLCLSPCSSHRSLQTYLQVHHISSLRGFAKAIPLFFIITLTSDPSGLNFEVT